MGGSVGVTRGSMFDMAIVLATSGVRKRQLKSP